MKRPFMNVLHPKNPPTFITETPRQVPVQDHFDVVVCGAGPAGIGAGIAAARTGARVALVDFQGCLGGVWTNGLLTYILDGHQKPGIMAEIRSRLSDAKALASRRDLFDVEPMKFLLEEMCLEAGVHVRLHARLCAAVREGPYLTHAIFEGKEGRFAFGAKAFIDATGDGDLGAFAGCGFDFGRPSDGLTQPMTMLALLGQVPAAVRQGPYASGGSGSCVNKEEFYQQLVRAGLTNLSYTKPGMASLPSGLCMLGINHSYEKSGLSSADLTTATLEARKEINQVVKAMRTFTDAWSELQLVATANHIGVREGRRLRGLYTVTAEDLSAGRRHEDAVVHVTFGVDIHSVQESEGGGYHTDSVSAKPYDIPLRALVAAGVENLWMAGRCISGDFHAHASYRVTGVAVPLGEAAGLAAAYSVAHECSSHCMDYQDILRWKKDRTARGTQVTSSTPTTDPL